VDPNPHTRRLLVDVLSSQNAFSQAAAEYRELLLSPDLDEKDRNEYFAQYEVLLVALGRETELQEWVGVPGS
jgi:hypothetical protein